MYAMGRYRTVRSALLDWQSFESSAGVGLTNFREEEPWRPPSLLLEADPPHHDAPRAVLSKILGPRELRDLAPRWHADADALVDDLVGGGERVRRRPHARRGVPAAGLPGCRRPRRVGTRAPAPVRRPPVQFLRPGELPGPSWTADARRSRRLGQRAVRARGAQRGRIRREDLGRRRQRRPDRTPSAADRPVTALRRRRHDGARDRRAHLCSGLEPGCLGAAAGRSCARARRVRRGHPPRIARPDLLPHHDDGRRTGRRAHSAGSQDPDVPRLGEPRSPALGRPGPVLARPGPVRPCRIRHGDPPVRRAARRAARGGGAHHGH